MAVTVWLSTMDSILGMGQNYLLYLHPVTRRFQFIPWDLDHAFGQFFPLGTPEQRENLSIRKPWAGAVRFLDRVYRLERFQKLYLSCLARLNGGLLAPDAIQRRVDELAAVLRPAVAEESAERLAQFERVVAGESVGPGGFGGPPPGAGAGSGPGIGPPSMGGPPGTGAQGLSAPGIPMAVPPAGPGFGPAGFAMPVIRPIKGFVVVRAASVRDQLAGRSEGMTVPAFGFGGPAGPPGTADHGAPPLPEGFGPGLFLGPVFMAQLDEDQDGAVTRAEFAAGCQRWFDEWDKDCAGMLAEASLRAGLNLTLQAFGAGPPAGAGLPVPGAFPSPGPPPMLGPALGPASPAVVPGATTAPAGSRP
jgi:hypothetical protein